MGPSSLKLCSFWVLNIIVYYIMETVIPDISKQVYRRDLLNVLEGKYSTLGPMWVNNQMEWLNGVYISFKNHDKFLIIIYLIKKTLDFYSRSFVRLTYDQFYERDAVEIEQFSINDIATELNIPKESARRKINELESIGVIKKSGKKIIIDRSSYEYIKPQNTIIRISRFLSALSNLCVNEKILSKKLTSQELENIIKVNFSYIWKIYYEMQIPMILNYKKIFLDIETFHIFGSCVVNQHLHKQKESELIMNRDGYINSIISDKFSGMNAMSISDITNIPRATVIRKLQKLVKNKKLTIDDKKLYRLSGNFVKTIKPTQTIVLDKLADFSTKVFNFALL